jgi:hypothetical protein
VNENVKNLISAFPNQPKLTFKDAINGSEFMNKTWLNLLSVVPGVFFFKNSYPSSYFFSYIFNVVHGYHFYESPYLVDDEIKILTFGDLSVTGPPTTVQIGYAVILQKDGKFQCSFAEQKHNVRIEAVFESFLSIFFIGLVCSFVLLSLVFFCLTLCCNGNYHEDKKNIGTGTRFYNTSKNIFLDFLITLFRPIQEDHVADIGTQAFFFLKFYKTVLIFISFFLFTSVPLMFLDSGFAFVKSFTTFDLSTISIASINLDDPLLSLVGIVHFFVGLIHMIFTFGLVATILYISRLTLAEEDESTRTLKITNLPKDFTDEKLLREKFENYFLNTEINSIHIAYDLEVLNKLNSKREALEENMETLVSIKENKTKKKWYQCFRKWKIESRIEKCQKKLDAVNSKIALEQEKALVGTGVAFITFNDKTSAQRCLKFATRNAKFIKEFQDEMLAKLSFEYAPPPTAIIWENLKYSFVNRIFRSIIGYIVVFILFAFVISIVLALESLTKFQEMFQLSLSKFYLDSNLVIKTILRIISIFLTLRGLITITFIISTFITIAILVKCVKKHSMIDELKSNARGNLFFLV